MLSKDVIQDAFGRVHDSVHQTVDGLTAEQLTFRVDSEANTIGWLIWHLSRVQDSHLADAAEAEQAWTSQGWVDRFGLPFDRLATGYGQTSADVGAVRADAALLLDYFDAVHQRTIGYISGLTDDALDRVVDKSWDPPVTLGVRLVSVISDGLQHVGQAAFVKGVVSRNR